MSGYFGWATTVHRLGWRLGGVWLRGEGATPPHSADGPTPGVVLPTLGGRDVIQLHWVAADVPVGLAPATFPFAILLGDEAAFWALHQARTAGDAVDFYPDAPLLDRYAVTRAAPDQTAWQLSRPLAWGDVPGVDLVSREPEVLLDGVALARSATSPPGAGEYYVPSSTDLDASADGYGDIETEPGGITGTWLDVRYHAIHRVRVEDLSLQLRVPNGWYASATFREVRQRVWVAA